MAGMPVDPATVPALDAADPFREMDAGSWARDGDPAPLAPPIAISQSREKKGRTGLPLAGSRDLTPLSPHGSLPFACVARMVESLAE
jgi:hypothetical protein